MAKPTRFVLIVNYDANTAAPNGHWGWHVLARNEDVKAIEDLVHKECKITTECVQDWFRKHARGWPVPERGYSLEQFVKALKTLRVCGSRTIEEHRASGSDNIGVSLESVRDAIHLIADNLPRLVENAFQSKYRHFTESQLSTLGELAKAALLARPLIIAPEPPRRETIWHDDACLIEWHIRRLLAENGHAEMVGYAAESPLTRLCVEALAATKCSKEHAAVNRALEVAAGKRRKGVTFGTLLAKGTHRVIA